MNRLNQRKISTKGPRIRVSKGGTLRVDLDDLSESEETWTEMRETARVLRKAKKRKEKRTASE